MPRRPLVLVSGLTVGDYLLWNWSLNHNHDVLALIAGLTLPPLAVACVWLLVLSGARLLARHTRRSPVHGASTVASDGRGAAMLAAGKPAATRPREAAEQVASGAATAQGRGRGARRRGKIAA